MTHCEHCVQSQILLDEHLKMIEKLAKIVDANTKTLKILVTNKA